MLDETVRLVGRRPIEELEPNAFKGGHRDSVPTDAGEKRWPHRTGVRFGALLSSGVASAHRSEVGYHDLGERGSSSAACGGGWRVAAAISLSFKTWSPKSRTLDGRRR